MQTLNKNTERLALALANLEQLKEFFDREGYTFRITPAFGGSFAIYRKDYANPSLVNVRSLGLDFAIETIATTIDVEHVEEIQREISEATALIKKAEAIING